MEIMRLPISASQTISQPYIVARMTELLEVNKDSRVLEIGAGSGYQTAVLSKVAGQVYSIERIGDLARTRKSRIRELGIYNATVKCFDGTLGWAANAPYDGILVAAGGPNNSEATRGPTKAWRTVGGARGTDSRIAATGSRDQDRKWLKRRRPWRLRVRSVNWTTWLGGSEIDYPSRSIARNQGLNLSLELSQSKP